MGQANVSRVLTEKPYLRQYYENYLLCRTTQILVFRKPDKMNTKEGAEKIVTVVWPSGFSCWPRAGGVDNQDYITTRLFAAALRGEQKGASRIMSR